MRRPRFDLLLMAGLGVALGAALSAFLSPALRVRAGANDPGGEAAATPDSTERSGRAGRASVPKLVAVNKAGTGNAVVDPRAPGYDPTAFAAVTPLGDLYAREPRNEDWARPVEGFLSAKMGRELAPAFPGLRVAGVECRTALCKVSFQEAEAAAVNRRKLQQVLTVLYSPSVAGFTDDLSFVMAFRGPVTWLQSVPGDDPRALFAAIDQRRAQLVASLREEDAKGERTFFNLVDLKELFAN